MLVTLRAASLTSVWRSHTSLSKKTFVKTGVLLVYLLTLVEKHLINLLINQNLVTRKHQPSHIFKYLEVKILAVKNYGKSEILLMAIVATMEPGFKIFVIKRD